MLEGGARAIEPAQVDHVVVGNVVQSASDSIYTPRHVGLHLGVPKEKPALGINRLCGSGFQVVVEVHHQMLAGDTQVALVGGVENMSMTPYVLENARWGMKMGHQKAQDMLTTALTDSYNGLPMAITAENLGAQYKVTREDADEFAYQSQAKTAAAYEAGRFKDEIAPFEVAGRKGPIVVDKDEHPRPDATLESLSGLKALFKKNGLVTAGNASGIVDGASAMVVATSTFAQEKNLEPLGRMVSYGIVGCDPDVMGIGPAPAARIALEKAGMKLGQMDLVEVNEAFAAQAVAVERELEIPREILNVNGGAIAIGHPLAASGTRILTTLLYELRRRKKRFGLGSACIGGGQGIAIIVEAF